MRRSAGGRGPSAPNTSYWLWSPSAALYDLGLGTRWLPAEAGCDIADLRLLLVTRCSPPRRGDDHDALLATLGVDLAEVRGEAEQTFGADAIARAASQARPRRPRRPLWSWISCSKPLPSRRYDSPLTGQRLDPIPRVERLVERASRTARPRPASPLHVLLALLTGNEPACEILADLGVDLGALVTATRRCIDGGIAAGRASERLVGSKR